MEPVKSKILLVILTLAGGMSLGCISQPPDEKWEKLNVSPVIDYYPLGGFTESAGAEFVVLGGSIGEVKEGLEDIVIRKAAPTSNFSVNDELNIVVFRGVFSTGGYGIKIDFVERHGNEFRVHAGFADPGKGAIVTQAFTQPAAIIPIGKLAPGEYKAALKVKKIIEDKEITKDAEEEKELMRIEFKVE